jgi:glycosyltransferase involved in cell wall biosynthesis
MGGATQLVYDITQRMHNSGQNVCIFTGLSDEQRSFSAKNNRILENVRVAGIPVEVCPFLQHRISPLNDLRALLWITRRLWKRKPGIVHIHSSKAGILGRLACKLAGIQRVIFHVHGWSFSRSRGVVRRVYLALEHVFYRLTTEYIFVSRQDILDFIQLGGNPNIESKSHVIYPGANFLSPENGQVHRQNLRRQLGLGDGDHVVGSIGRLDYQKNPQMFVTIAQEYAKIDPTAYFIWIGEGDEREEVEKLINTLNLSDRFLLPGYVEDVEPYYHIFDTFALTSRYEGLPLAVIKALASGTPVVEFLSNGMVDLNAQFRSVLGVPPGDVNHFVKQLKNAQLMLTEELDVLEEEAEYVRENLNIDRMYEAVMAVYTCSSESTTLPSLASNPNSSKSSGVGSGRDGQTRDRD